MKTVAVVTTWRKKKQRKQELKKINLCVLLSLIWLPQMVQFLWKKKWTLFEFFIWNIML